MTAECVGTNSFSNQPTGAGETTHRIGHGERETLICCYWQADVRRSLNMTHKATTLLLSRVVLQLAYIWMRVLQIATPSRLWYGLA